ncbi:hypothetical protein RIF29_06638 [Crotalaria pallida]|uniref:Late embryogenesis abundant protein LEA-2 subgroup domain-containing protein n=1 Tax=Crotalaria pallida TaxID=3830 RepID=A0AAN9PB07_CROPI
MMITPKACFSKHSQWPPKSFRLRQGLRASAALFLPWMSEWIQDHIPIWFNSHNKSTMHAKHDSDDVTSYDHSSLRSSPPPAKPPVYFVQSPSRDSSSHDGDKFSNMHATPNFHSPMESPLHSASSASRVSGVYNNNISSGLGKKGNQKMIGHHDKGWHDECKVIEEEGEYGDFYHGRSKGLSRRTQVFVALVGFVLIFCVFCLIIWGASRPYKPKIRVKRLTIHNFYFGEGSDMTGVGTKMLTVNCSVKMTVHNPATFFGIHVSSNPVNLKYSEITVATGELKKYYQQRKSDRIVSVNLQGNKVPLYGAGASFAGSTDNEKIPMKLVFEVRSQGNIVGKLVKSKHCQHVSCSVDIDSHNNKPIILKDSLCTYA